MKNRALKDVQEYFYKSVVGEYDNLDFISSKDAKKRLDVYKNTIFENMRSCLSAIFCGTWSLLGEECSNSVAKAFYKDITHFPQSGCLDDWGSEFPDFLATIEELKSVPYISNYAKYEWIKHKSYISESSDYATYLDFNNIRENEIDSIRINLIASAFLFSSNFPIRDIDMVAKNQYANEINLSLSDEYAVIARPEYEIDVMWIDKADYVFIDALVQSYELGESIKKACEVTQEFNLTKAIQFLLQNRLIKDIIKK